MCRLRYPMYLWRLFYFWTPGQCAIQKSEAYLYACGVVFCSTVNVSVLHPYMMAVMHVGMKIRVACCSLIYRKVKIKIINDWSWIKFSVSGLTIAFYIFGRQNCRQCGKSDVKRCEQIWRYSTVFTLPVDKSAAGYYCSVFSLQRNGYFCCCWNYGHFDFYSNTRFVFKFVKQ